MNSTWMLTACGIALVGHWLDLYMMVFPPFFSSPMIGWVDIALSLGFVALFLCVFVRNLDPKRLIPHKDPYLDESIGRERLELISGGHYSGTLPHATFPGEMQ